MYQNSWHEGQFSPSSTATQHRPLSLTLPPWLFISWAEWADSGLYWIVLEKKAKNFCRAMWAGLGWLVQGLKYFLLADVAGARGRQCLECEVVLKNLPIE